MRKKNKRAARGTLKLTARERRVHDTFGEEFATPISKKNSEFTVRSQAVLRDRTAHLKKLLRFLKRADPRLLAAAVELFESEEKAVTWLATIHHITENKTPLQLAASPAGRKKVLHVLGKIENNPFL